MTQSKKEEIKNLIKENHPIKKAEARDLAIKKGICSERTFYKNVRQLENENKIKTDIYSSREFLHYIKDNKKIRNEIFALDFDFDFIKYFLIPDVFGDEYDNFSQFNKRFVIKSLVNLSSKDLDKLEDKLTNQEKDKIFKIIERFRNLKIEDLSPELRTKLSNLGEFLIGLWENQTLSISGEFNKINPLNITEDARFSLNRYVFYVLLKNLLLTPEFLGKCNSINDLKIHLELDLDPQDMDNKHFPEIKSLVQKKGEFDNKINFSPEEKDLIEKEKIEKIWSKNLIKIKIRDVLKKIGALHMKSFNFDKTFEKLYLLGKRRLKRLISNEGLTNQTKQKAIKYLKIFCFKRFFTPISFPSQKGKSIGEQEFNNLFEKYIEKKLVRCGIVLSDQKKKELIKEIMEKRYGS